MSPIKETDSGTNEKLSKTGYSTLTYKVRLYDRHFAWLVKTRTLYAQVLEHYYQILRNNEEWLTQSDFLLMRSLEMVSVGTKEMKQNGEKPLYPLTDFPKIPLYFRRAAINQAIAVMRKCRRQNKEAIPYQAFHSEHSVTPLFYKGMYRNMTETEVELKLYNGEKWKWVKYPFHGRAWPKEGQVLSPFLVLQKKNAYLHIPIKTVVEDIRPLNERMKTESYLCAVAFPNYDTLAVGVIMTKEGAVKECRFFHGGKQRDTSRNITLLKLKKSKRSRGKQVLFVSSEQFITSKYTSILESIENRKLYERILHINQHYCHKISHEILKYCLEKQVKIIVVPNYKEPMDVSAKQYSHTNVYLWQGRSIIKKLKYKAFAQGIIVATIPTYHITSHCSECGAKIRRYNEDAQKRAHSYEGTLFWCPNGHRGNTAFNTAKNIGRNFLKRFERVVGKTFEWEIDSVETQKKQI